jgi:hypothetical protein
MAPEDLLEVKHRQPFEPFRFVMTNGATFEVWRPELLMVGRSAAIVGVVTKPSQSYHERTEKLALEQVVRIEPIRPNDSLAI